MKWPLHGSSPQYLYQSMGMTLPDSYIDFSANINPLGPPSSLKTRWNQSFALVSDYPDPKAFQFAEKAAEKAGLPIDWILPGNGGAELITLIARVLAGKKVLIVQPAFSEYEEACRANGCEVGYHLLEEPDWKLDADQLIQKLHHYDALFLCNPNNPTGQSFASQAVLKMLEESNKSGCLVILDEAFYDFLDDPVSFAAYIHGYPNLIILRSLTKMYSIPGLRLGYAIAHPPVIKALSAFQPHWSVNALALMAGEASFEAEGREESTRQFIGRERALLMKFFRETGLACSDSKINFYLLKDKKYMDQLPLIRFLMEHGIIPRHTYNFPGLDGRWIRLAIKRNNENTRLMEVLAKWRTEGSSS